MAQVRIPATYMRGGSSKGVFFRARDLPEDPQIRDRIFLLAIGSPDPYGRQLNGMGGGVSSVSKAVVIGAPSRSDADIDYTFAQVAVDAPAVDYASNCGNLSSAVGPFAIDNALIPVGTDGHAEIRIHNTNSGKIIRATVPLEQDFAKVEGDFAIPGVAGTGARIRLDFLDPGGAATGRLLPSGRLVDTLTIHGHGRFEFSAIDSSVPCIFLDARCFGLHGTESVADLEADSSLMLLIERIRRDAAVAIGMAPSPKAVSRSSPKIGVVAAPGRYQTLSDSTVSKGDADITARIWSMGQVHRVLPLTAAMCLAVACRIPGSVPNAISCDSRSDLRIANPSGVLPLDAQVSVDAAGPVAHQVTAYRTARSLMEGYVMVPGQALAAGGEIARRFLDSLAGHQ